MNLSHLSTFYRHTYYTVAYLLFGGGCTCKLSDKQGQKPLLDVARGYRGVYESGGKYGRGLLHSQRGRNKIRISKCILCIGTDIFNTF